MSSESSNGDLGEKEMEGEQYRGGESRERSGSSGESSTGDCSVDRRDSRDSKISKFRGTDSHEDSLNSQDDEKSHQNSELNSTNIEHFTEKTQNSDTDSHRSTTNIESTEKSRSSDTYNHQGSDQNSTDIETNEKIHHSDTGSHPNNTDIDQLHTKSRDSNIPNTRTASGDSEFAVIPFNDHDAYTLNTVNSSSTHGQPARLVESHPAPTRASIHSNDSSLRTRFKKSFTFSVPSRKLSILRRRRTALGHDVERDAAKADEYKADSEIAEELVLLHQNSADYGDDGGSSDSDSDDQTLTSTTTSAQRYFAKEEYDDEISHVNDQFSEIPNNVQTGILSSLLKLYHENSGAQYRTITESDSDREEEQILDENRRNLQSYTHHLDLPGAPRHPIIPEPRNSSSMEDLVAGMSDINPSKSMSELELLRSRFNKSFKSSSRALSPMSVRRRKLRPRLTDSSDDKEAEVSQKLPTFKRLRKEKRLLIKSKIARKHNQLRLKITVHIADILHRQKFILKLCKTFMLYGAPTHRLEEYLIATARVLEIDASFIYFPGCMLISFGDATTRTSEMHLVRCAQGLDLGRLHDVHLIYKKVMHDMVSVDDVIDELDTLLLQKPLYNHYVLILANGLASLFITSWGFKGGWRDMPISFILGSLVGFLQIVVSPRSNTYSSAFEVSSSILVLFISRGFGSISWHGEQSIFCFSAIAQSSLVAILPGYTILCGSLELQSRNMVSGAVRMFYAIIYSLFLGFGIILGSLLYKWVDKSATTLTTCPADLEISDYYRFLFVPCFALTQLIIGQLKFHQIPVMIFISCASYVGYYYASLHFSSSAEFSAAIGAFLVGILGNLYSRVGQGLAVALMYPGILLLVPGSVGLKSSLSSGVVIADEIVTGAGSSTSSSDNSLSFGIAMIEVAIGLCVGLIGAAVVVYPFGKTRTGLFTL